MYCNGESPWRKFVNQQSGNEGSNMPAIVWDTLADTIPTPYRDRVWPGGRGDRSMHDVRLLRKMGWIDPILLVTPQGNNQNPMPLPLAPQYVAEVRPIHDAYANAIGLTQVPLELSNENIDHINYGAPQAAINAQHATLADTCVGIIEAWDGPTVAPCWAAGHPQTAAFRVAMDKVYKHPKLHGIAVHIRETNFDDVAWLRAHYPDKYLYITEFGTEHLNEADTLAFIDKCLTAWVADPKIAAVCWFTLPVWIEGMKNPDGSPDMEGAEWAPHFPTVRIYQALKLWALKWHTTRRFLAPAAATVVQPAPTPQPSPVSNAAAINANAKIVEALGARQRTAIAGLLNWVKSIDSDAQEIRDRGKMIEDQTK